MKILFLTSEIMAMMHSVGTVYRPCSRPSYMY